MNCFNCSTEDRFHYLVLIYYCRGYKNLRLFFLEIIYYWEQFFISVSVIIQKKFTVNKIILIKFANKLSNYLLEFQLSIFPCKV